MTTIPAKKITVIGGKLIKGTLVGLKARACGRIIHPIIEISDGLDSRPILELEFNTFGSGNLGARLSFAGLLEAFNTVWEGESPEDFVSEFAISRVLNVMIFRLENISKDQIAIHGVMSVESPCFHNLLYEGIHEKSLVEKVFELRRSRR